MDRDDRGVSELVECVGRFNWLPMDAAGVARRHTRAPQQRFEARDRRSLHFVARGAQKLSEHPRSDDEKGSVTSPENVRRCVVDEERPGRSLGLRQECGCRWQGSSLARLMRARTTALRILIEGTFQFEHICVGTATRHGRNHRVSGWSVTGIRAVHRPSEKVEMGMRKIGWERDVRRGTVQICRSPPPGDEAASGLRRSNSWCIEAVEKPPTQQRCQRHDVAARQRG